MASYHQQRLNESQLTPTALGRLLNAIMLPFEVLHRQRWSAPWEIAGK